MHKRLIDYFVGRRYEPMQNPLGVVMVPGPELADRPFAEMIEALKRGVTRDELRRSERG